MISSIYIEINPEIKRGRPVFKGTRVPIDGLIDYIESGMTVNDFINDFPSVTKEMANGLLEDIKCDLLAV